MIVRDGERLGYPADEVAALLVGVAFGVLENATGNAAAATRAGELIAELVEAPTRQRS